MDIPTKTEFMYLGTTSELLNPADKMHSSYPSFSAEQIQEIKSSMNELKVPALSIAVVNEDFITAMSFGFSDVQKQLSNTPSTLFHIASTSKAFTAAATSVLVEDNINHPEIQWNSSISLIMGTDFQLADNHIATQQVSIEDALSHRSGLPGHYNSLFQQEDLNVTEFFERLKHLPLTSLPGLCFQYGNIMYVVIVRLIESVTGRKIDEFLRQRIWEKLDMHDTFFSLADYQRSSTGQKPFTNGYVWSAENKEYEIIPCLSYSAIEGASSMLSNILDYAKWVWCIANQSAPLSQKAHEALLQPRIPKSGPKGKGVSLTFYGLGWTVMNYRGECVAFHGGSLPGFSSLIICIPSRKWGVAAFANTAITGTTLANKTCWNLIDDLLGIPASDRNDWSHKTDKGVQGDDKTETLFRELERERRPMSAMIGMYTGEYSDKGYGSLNAVLRDGKLFIDATDRLWRSTISFEHVTADSFVLEQYKIDWRCVNKLKGEFQVNTDGIVERLGIAFEESMGGEMIWFKKKAQVTKRR